MPRPKRSKINTSLQKLRATGATAHPTTNSQSHRNPLTVTANDLNSNQDDDDIPATDQHDGATQRHQILLLDNEREGSIGSDRGDNWRIVRPGIPGPSASTDSLAHGWCPKWGSGYVQPAAIVEENDIAEDMPEQLVMSGALQQAVMTEPSEIRSNTPRQFRESPQLKKAKRHAARSEENAKKSAEKAHKAQDAQKRKSLRASKRLSAGNSSLTSSPNVLERGRMKVTSTPSMLSIANFKKRPRQPSLLRMVQQTEDALRSDDDSHLDASILAGLNRSSPAQEDAISDPSSPIAHTSSSHKRKAASLSEKPLSSPVVKAPRSRGHIAKVAASPTLIATSPISSPQSARPLETQSLYPEREPRSKKSDLKTATLQMFLPKRMRHGKNAYHVGTNTYDGSENSPHEVDGAEDDEVHVDEEEDELTRPARRRRVRTAANKRTDLVHPHGKTRGRRPLGESPDKARNMVAKIATTAKAKVRRTYGRSPVENVENLTNETDHDDNDENDNNMDEDERNGTGKITARRKDRLSGELVAAKEKFEQVDEWKLDFETCDVGGGSSSPWR